MNGRDVPEITTPTTNRACLAKGCACKDARIVSTRRAAFFASMARSRGETADRFVPADPSWAIPVFAHVELPIGLDALATDLDAAV